MDDRVSGTQPSPNNHHREANPNSHPAAKVAQSYQTSQFSDIPLVPHNEYPKAGMTQFCRTAPLSQQSSVVSQARPSSRDSQSDCSNPTSLSSMEPPSGTQSPTKQAGNYQRPIASSNEPQKKQGGVFGGHSPFRRKSKHELSDSRRRETAPDAGNENNWATPTGKTVGKENRQSAQHSRQYGHDPRGIILHGEQPSASPEPVDPRANFQLNIGNNVFDVASPEAHKRSPTKTNELQDDLDPIAQALAELKGVTKQSSVRMSADRYHGLATPAPGTPSVSGTTIGMPYSVATSASSAAQRGTPPPSYDQPSSLLGAPQPAFTSRAMQQTTQRYVDQKQNMFNSAPQPSTFNQRSWNSSSRQSGQGSSRGQDVMRATSPVPPRSTSPRPALYGESQPRPQYQPNRAVSPSPYPGSSRPRAKSSTPVKHQRDGFGGYRSREGSPNTGPIPRAISPQPGYRANDRPNSSRGSDLSLQLAPTQQPSDGPSYGMNNAARGGRGRPMSYYGGGSEGAYAPAGGGEAAGGHLSTRVRSKSVADASQYTTDGRPILHYCESWGNSLQFRRSDFVTNKRPTARAMYVYQAAIPQELSFAKGDLLAVLGHQDDGWWEAEVVGKPGRPGLVPSNYLQNCSLQM